MLHLTVFQINLFTQSTNFCFEKLFATLASIPEGRGTGPKVWSEGHYYAPSVSACYEYLCAWYCGI